MADIWERWEEHYRELGIDPANMYRDGIVNEGSWNMAKRKILFLVKEPNGNDYKKLSEEKQKKYNRDLTKWWDERAWKEIGYFSYGLQHVTESFIPKSEEAKKNILMACQQSAIMNLKKLPGGGKADNEEIKQFAKNDREFLEEEIGIIISPQIIVHCGTITLCPEVWTKGEPIVPRIYEYSCFQDIVWIDYIHPSQPNLKGKNIDIMYYALAAIYQKYLQK